MKAFNSHLIVLSQGSVGCNEKNKNLEQGLRVYFKFVLVTAVNCPLGAKRMMLLDVGGAPFDLGRWLRDGDKSG